MTGAGAARGRVTVVVAAPDARPAPVARLERFAAEVSGRGEMILVDASRAGLTGRPLPDCVRVLRRPPGTLAPVLWRDGLLDCETPLVALTTATMAPAPGWLDALLDRRDATGAAAVGGPIDPAPGLGPVDRAVYLLRYIRYVRPLPGTSNLDPPGDNALYVLDRLFDVETAWSSGFWEAAVHRVLRRIGGRLAMSADAAVTYQGGARLGPTSVQRFRHARHYGADRAAGMGWAERLTRTAAAPVVPPVLLRRALATLRARGGPIAPWAPAGPSLAVLLAAWAAGEAAGLVLGAPPPVVVRLL
jgi:hypothetical protein